MAQQIQLRHDTAANWTSANPTLMVGEFGYETDTGKFKLGDGSTAWASLSYTSFPAGQITGQVPVGSGGTGLATLTAHGVLVGEGTSNVALVGPSSTAGQPLCSNGSSNDPSFQTVPVVGGGTGKTSVTTSPTASAWAGWDANDNLSANNLLAGYATTAAAGGTTTLTVASASQQYFTGSGGQTVQLPVASTLVLGQSWEIVNNCSSGNLTIQSSGANNIATVLPGSAVIVTCILTSGTTAASWSTNSAGGNASPLTTKGDVYTFTNINVRHAVPADNGFLVPDSQQTDGWRNAPSTWTNGRPGKNYVKYADFENNAIIGWSKMSVTLSNSGTAQVMPSGSPNTSTGGASIGTFAATSSNPSPIAGTYSLQVSSLPLATLASGDGFISDPMPVDSADQAKVLGWRAYYSVTSGTKQLFPGTYQGTWGCYLYESTDGGVTYSWRQPAGVYNFVQGSGTGIAQGTYQTASNATHYRIAFVCLNTTASEAATQTIVWDDFYFGPQAIAFGPAMNDSTSWTPTFTGFGTVTGVTAYSRRIGDRLLGQITFTAGTVTASTAAITLGYNGANSNVTIDANKIASHSIVGHWIRSGTTTGQYNNPIIASPSGTSLNFGYTNGTSGAQTAEAANSLIANGETISLFFDVPITGWSSNTVQSADTDTRVISGACSTLSSTTMTAGTALKWTSTTYDDAASYSSSTGGVTLPVSGKYSFRWSGIYAASGGTDFHVYVNGASRYTYVGSVNTSGRCSCGVEVKGNAGDVVTIVPVSTCTAGDTISYLFWERLSGPAVVQATESVNARYTTVAGQSIANGTTPQVNFDTKDFDSHSAVTTGSSWKWTAPVSGKVSLKACAMFAGSQSFSSGNPIEGWVYKNGSLHSRFAFQQTQATFTGRVALIGSSDISVLAGDYLDVRISHGETTARTLSTTAGDNWVAIERVGN